MKTHAVIEQVAAAGAIRIEFQPILTLTGDGVELYALEALARGPRGTNMERPDVLFEYARRKGEETRIDMIVIGEALCAAATLPGQPSITINVHGSTLSNVPNFAANFLAAASAVDIVPERLMLEIVEHRAPWDLDSLRATLGQLRDAGVRIALDDLGVAASNYRLFVDCRPDHLKIDRYIVGGCSTDPYRLAVLHSIVSLARSCGAVPIAEGIEDPEDLATVRELGIRHVQGWMFSPSLTPAEISASRFFNEQKKDK